MGPIAIELSQDGILTKMQRWLSARYASYAAQNELCALSPGDYARTFQDLAISEPNLMTAIRGGNLAAPQLVARRLEGLGLSAATLDPAVLSDLHRVCASCQKARRCRRDFARANANEVVGAYCPNGDTLDALTSAA